jgi:chromosome partitioning protein
MRITFLNQKGGVGKTTIALLIASVLQKSGGYDVAIDDQDPQDTAKFFATSFELPLLSENPKAEYIITDTPGHLKLEGSTRERMAKTIEASDKLILVTEKSPASIHSSMAMAQLIKDKMRPDARAYVLFNKVRINTTIGKQDAKPIAKDFGLPALKNELPLTVAYEAAFVSGLSAVTGEHRALLLNVALEIMK